VHGYAPTTAPEPVPVSKEAFPCVTFPDESLMLVSQLVPQGMKFAVVWAMDDVR
jgi:hypothetical protein